MVQDYIIRLSKVIKLREKKQRFSSRMNRIFHNTISQIAPIIEISKIVEN